MENIGKAEQAALAFIKAATRPFIAHPESMEVEVIPLRTESTITVRPHWNDYGYVVGSRGAMVDALSILMRQIGSKHGRPIKLAVLNSKQGETGERALFQRTEHWDKALLEKIADKVLRFVLPEPVTVIVEDRDDLSIVRVRCGAMPEDAALVIERALGTLFLSIGKGLGRGNTLVELTTCFVGKTSERPRAS